MMKAIDITADFNRYCEWAKDPNDSWTDYVDWKDMRAIGVEAVIINGRAYVCGKHGLGEEIPLDQVKEEV